MACKVVMESEKKLKQIPEQQKQFNCSNCCSKFKRGKKKKKTWIFYACTLLLANAFLVCRHLKSTKTVCFFFSSPLCLVIALPTLGGSFHGNEACLNLNVNLNFRG